MAFLLCKRTGTGPNCSDIRLESTKPEKEDCIKKATLDCIKEVWNCRADLLKNFPDNTIGTTSTVEETLGDQECYPYTCLDKILECYCAGGLAGLTCSLCDDERNGVGTGPDDEEPEEEEEEETPYKGPVKGRITLSSHGDYIPMVFGTVRLSGNIAWCYGPRSVSVEREVSVGGFISTATYTGKAVDLMLGLCEGEVEHASKVWFSGVLAYDATSTTGPALRADQKDKGVSITLRRGSPAQKVVKRMADVEGFGRVPAYRDLAYIFVSAFPVQQAGNGVPDIRVEVTNVVSGGPATFSTGNVTAVNNDVLDVDESSGRAVVSKAGSVILFSTATLNEEHAWSDTIKSDSLAIDGLNGGVAYMTSASEINYISPVNLDWKIESTVGAISPDHAALYSFASSTYERVSSYIVTDNEDLYMYRIDHIARTASLVRTITGGSLGLSSSYKFATIGNFSLLGETSPDILAYLVNQDASKNVHFITYQYFKPSASLYYSESRTPTHISYTPKQLGCRTTTATLLSVLHLVDRSQLVLFFQEGTTYTAACVEHGSIDEPVWTTTQLVAAPSGQIASRGGATDYRFISGGTCYSIDLDSGALEEVYSLSGAGAPLMSASGSQYYDSVKGAVIYTNAAGTISGIYPERISASPTTLSATVDTILSRAGLKNEEFDSSSLSTITVDGYMVANQPQAGNALAELQEFFAFGSYESSSKIKSVPLGYYNPVVIDGDYTTTPASTRRILDFDTLHYARVGYFDRDKDFSYYYQEVSLDMIRGDDNGEALEGFDYGLNIFTDANTARRSAEVSLNRRIQNSEDYSLHLPPKYLAVEPVDFLVFDGGKMRVSKTVVGGSFSTEAAAHSDDEDIYNNLSTLGGVVINPVTFTVEDFTTFPNKIVAVQAPNPTTSKKTTIWIGEVNPVAGSAFSASPIRVAGPNEATSRAVFPVSEATVGRLITAPSVLGNSMIIKSGETLVVEFSKEVNAAMFPTKSAIELYASFTDNLLLVGKELIQFLSASIAVDNRTVTFSGLLRGRFGTDQTTKMYPHAINELVALYTPDSIKVVALTPAANTARFASMYQYRDALAGYYSSEVVAPYVDVSSPQYLWSSVYMKAKKTASGITFYTYLRNAHIAEFADTGHRTLSSVNITPYLYILKAPYDEATFRAKYATLDYHQGTATTANANTYIRRRMALNNNTKSLATIPNSIVNGNLYTISLVNSDIGAITNDMHAAVVIHPGGDAIDTTARAIIGVPTGLKIEGSANFTTAKQLLRYN